MTKHHLDDRELRELMAAITHDLSNPLAALLTNLDFAEQLSRQNAVDPDLHDAIKDSVAACDVLRQIVANLDVFVKGKHRGCSLREVSLGALVEAAIDRVRARLVQAGLDIDYAPPLDQPRAMVDASLLELALENLLANSIQYAPRSSAVRITIHTDERGFADIEVRDEGDAIPDDQRELALSVGGNTHRGRNDQSRYGRGATLLAARAAASATGAELVLGSGGAQSTMSLRVPTTESIAR